MTDLLIGPSVGSELDSAERPLSAAGLRSNGNRTACVVGNAHISHAQLADLVDERRAALGSEPVFTVLHGPNSLEFVVAYLAAIDGGHPVIVAPNARAAAELAERFGAAACVDARDGAIVRTAISQHGRTDAWHPDLAVLMGTSGSTRAPKLVRLSERSITSNAMAIAESLGITARDRAITSLPLHYCYGLSLVTSHLAVGASVVLTDVAVVDPCFWSAVKEHGVTMLAGVPHTFELIECSGVEVLAAPSLRVVTQAGGRLEPAKVESFAELGRTYGWDFVVMYGQTEATARMSVLNASDDASARGTVGRPIRGGRFRLDPVDGQPDGVGEVVYRGPNVMMGYATEPGHVARGADHDELHTGDLGRFDAFGNLEIVGRRSGFLKLHGKRVDLDHLAERLATEADEFGEFKLVGDDSGLVVGLLDPSASEVVLDEVARECLAGLVDIPKGLVLAARVPQWPRTASGKVDGVALTAAVREASNTSESLDGDATVLDAAVVDAFATIFGTTPQRQASFVSLGGDSFSYVEMSIRLESVIGDLPAGWHLMTIEQLDQLAHSQVERTWWNQHTAAVDTSVIVRAVGILLIVCTHMGIYRLAGGAHALLAVVGYNVARFQLLPTDVSGRIRRAVSTVARIAVPTSAWIAFNMVVAGGYSLGTVLLINNYTGSPQRRDGRWEYWYFEAFVQIMVVLAIVFSTRRVRHAERARPMAFAVGVLALTWLFRFEIVNLGGAYNEIFRTHTVLCFFALGWCAQRAGTVWQRLMVTGLALVTTLGYFETVGRSDQLDRELRILAMVLALVWVSSVRLPRPVAAVVGRIAAASMWIFLVHWQVWPLLTPHFDDRFAYALTILSGVVVWKLVSVASAAWSRWRERQRRVDVRSTSNQVKVPDTAISKSDVTPVSA
ncbi:MAG: AMP-binding protein [Ilumatobacter sp.]